MANIIIIDDNEEICTLIQSILQKKGHHVKVAPDGKKAKQLCQSNKFDLIITDIFMPEKDGFELIKDFKCENKNAKIIAMSGGGIVGDVEDFLHMAERLGADYTFKKPVDDKRLIEVVDELTS